MLPATAAFAQGHPGQQVKLGRPDVAELPAGLVDQRPCPGAFGLWQVAHRPLESDAVTTSTRAGPRDDSPGRPLTFDLSVAIQRPPAAVFAFLADVQDQDGAGIRMTKIPAGPTAVGTRWHEQVRLVPGLWMPVDSVVTEIGEPILLGMNFRSIWCTGHLTYTIEATPQGSILRQRETLLPRWPLRWLAAWVDARLRPHLLTRLAGIQAQLESA